MRSALVLLAAVTLSACSRSSPSPAPLVSTPTTGTTGMAVAQRTASPPVERATPQPVSLRAVNWATVLSNDPDLERQVPPSPAPGFGDLYVRYKAGKVGGYPEIGDVLYGDLNGDGQEEAVITLQSGGTAGVVGFLVYAATPTGPRIVAAQEGYKLALSIDGGRLLTVRSPVYAGWEPNCCPSSVRITRYRLQGNDLIVEAEQREPFPELKVLTVERFYTLLAARRYQDAYNFLSPAFQAANPYPTWAAGYATTEHISAEVRAEPDGAVAVALTVTERTASGLQTRRFIGRWSLIFSDERNQWLLDQAAIAQTSQ